MPESPYYLWRGENFLEVSIIRKFSLEGLTKCPKLRTTYGGGNKMPKTRYYIWRG